MAKRSSEDTNREKRRPAGENTKKSRPRLSDVMRGANKDSRDNVVYMDSSEKALENNNRAREIELQKKRISTLLFILLVAIAILTYTFVINKRYKGYKIVSSNDTNYENTAKYIQFGENLLKFTADGASYINANGDVVWSAGINMKMPIADSCENYAVIADLNGNGVCVFDTKGQVASLTMPYTICDVDIAKQGAFAVVLESDKTNYINLYNKNGEIVYEIQTTLDKSGYPLDISISEDGEKLFTSYLYVNGTNMDNNLTAYNFGDVGQNSNADRMVGGYMFEDQIVSKVEFVNNDTVVAYGTKSVSVYSMKEKPTERKTISLENEIMSVFYCDDYFGFITKNGDGSSEHLYKMRVYDLHGNLKFKENIDFGYTNIYAAPKEIIVSGGNECMIVRTNGRIKFSGHMTKIITSVVPAGKRNEYVVTYANCTEIIKLKSDEGVANAASNTDALSK